MSDRLQRRTQGDRSDATKAALLRVARSSFGRKGYAATSAEDVVREAGMTSGALYHHFAGKRDLFRSVFESLEKSLADRVRRAASRGRHPWAGLELGVAEYLEACSENEFRQIVLVDGPSVLGLNEWRDADARHHLRPLAASLAGAMRAGQLERRPALPMARVLLGLLTETGLAAQQDRAAAEEACFWILRRMRAAVAGNSAPSVKRRSTRSR